jgi:hypothetical protein
VDEVFRFRRRRRAPAQEAAAHVDARWDRLFVTSWSLDQWGMWRANGWFAELADDAEPTTLGDTVLEALRRSKGLVKATDEPLAPVFRAAGVKTWGQYLQGLCSVTVARRYGRISIRPQRNLGARQGLTELPDERRELVDPTAEALGAAVHDALMRAISHGESATSEAVGAPASFGYKRRWLAVRSEDPGAVANALALEDMRPATWRDGIERNEDDLLVFVTPPIDGWTLALIDSAIAEPDLAELSRAFGEAQLFGTHRVPEYHEWQRWVDGSPVRRYCWIGDRGEIPFDQGEPAAAEAGIARSSDLDRDWDELEFADEETVLEVAREWSVDPSTLDARTDLPDEGLIGRRGRT